MRTGTTRPIPETRTRLACGVSGMRSDAWLDRPARIEGYSLVEIAIVLAIVGAMTAMAMPNLSQYLGNANGRAAAKSVADAFNFARAQAIRTGNNQVVFFAIGGAGYVDNQPLLSVDGRPVPILVLDDGRPGTANQNCKLDAGETFVTFDAQRGVGWGPNAVPVTSPAPDDTNSATIPAAGSSLLAPNGTTRVTWVMFRPDGVPVAIDNACSAGRTGSGGGAIYLWTDRRDYAVTLAPLGGVRVHTWNVGAGAWTS